METKTLKAISIEIYKNNLFNGCSNGGITEKYDELLLICDNGNINIDPNNIPENLVKKVKQNFFGDEYEYIEPYAPPTQLGYMFGGSFGYSCDSRFKSNYALKIYDRQETQEEYNRLSQ